MRVLWFSCTTSNYVSPQSPNDPHGGWVASLENIVTSHDDIELAVAFESTDSIFKDIQHGVTYYPMNLGLSRRQKQSNVNGENKAVISAGLKVIDDFKPDIIQMFGSEWGYGLLKEYTKIPIVIHIQGSLPQYRNCTFPPGFSFLDNIFFRGVNIKAQIGDWQRNKSGLQRVKREEKILSINEYYMGRTDWDYSLIKLYNPKSKYFLCNEGLNEVFFTSNHKWKPKNDKVIHLMTTGASFLKGLDVIYKTSMLLKEHGQKIDFVVTGRFGEAVRLIEHKLGVNSRELDIHLLGNVPHQSIVEHLLASDMYIHPAYAENSPNSICEAQILGVPVIATFCGGIPSLVLNGKTGILVPQNDPYYLASKIIQLKNDPQMQLRLSEKEIEVASKRHAPDNIYKELLDCYHAILESNK